MRRGVVACRAMYRAAVPGRLAPLGVLGVWPAVRVFQPLAAVRGVPSRRVPVPGVAAVRVAALVRVLVALLPCREPLAGGRGLVPAGLVPSRTVPATAAGHLRRTRTR